MTEFLHELVKQRERDIMVAELLDSDPWEYPDPWRYSEPPPPFTGNINTQEQRDPGEPY